MNLTKEEIAQCRQAFASFDTDRSGSIDMDELKEILKAMRITIEEDELTAMLNGVTDSMSDSMDFTGFLKLIEVMKFKIADIDRSRDLANAWDALGGISGGSVKGGAVNRELLHNVMTENFGLTVNIEDLIRTIDADENGDVEFEEFKKFLNSSNS